MAKLERVGLFSMARFQAVLTAFVGLVAGILYSFGGLVMDILVSIGWVSSASASTPGVGFGTVLAFGALIGMPVIFAGIGFLLGLVQALVFNLLAGWFGGMTLDFEEGNRERGSIND